MRCCEIAHLDTAAMTVPRPTKGPLTPALSPSEGERRMAAAKRCGGALQNAYLHFLRKYGLDCQRQECGTGNNQLSIAIMKIQRRQFLKQSALGMSGMLMGARFATSAESKATRFDPYEAVPL